MDEPAVNPSVLSPNGDWSGLRVVHAANYQFAKDGAAFFNCDLKFHQGLVQNGCFVYPFSINDHARMRSLIRSKTFGMAAANRALLRTCRQVQPDVLMLGHAQHVDSETLQRIRDALPDLRICLWYVDPIWSGSPIQHIHARLEVLDAVFTTTGGEHLKALARRHCPAAFIPNPVEPSIERGRAFEIDRPDYDLVFFGRDKNEPKRRQFLSQLLNALGNARVGLFGCLGRPLVFGAEKERILCRSRMALNLSRRNDVELYSSDRIGQIIGNGVLSVTSAGCGLERLFGEDEVVFFHDVDSAVELIRRLVADDGRARRIAHAGWKRAHRDYSAVKITRYMLDVTLRRENWRTAPWAPHVYGVPSAPGKAPASDSGRSVA